LNHPLVSIVIVNWDGKRHLEHCLPSVLKQTYANYEVIVVDNGSNDGSGEYVERDFSQVLLIRNKENLGFAKANNIGIKAAKGKYIATLNNDTIVDSHWLSELVKAAEGNKKVGMVASKMLRFFPYNVIDSAGIVMDKAGTSYDRGQGEQDLGQFETPQEVIGPCAGAALWRRDMLAQIGLFDENYFVFLEDLDLAYRARLGGWRCIYVPKAIVYHVHSASTGGAGSAFKYYIIGRNRLWTIFKDFSIKQMIVYFPLIASYTVLMVAYDLAVKHRLAAVKGVADAMRCLPQVLAKRREIHGKRQVPYSEIERLLEWPKSLFVTLRLARRREKLSKADKTIDPDFYQLLVKPDKKE